MRRHFFLIPALLASALGQSKNPAPANNTERGVMVRQAELYLQADKASSRIGEIDRGREVAILDRSRDYVEVFANIGPEKDLTGWILNKGVIEKNTPNGDRILFGEASDSEDQAASAHGRRGAAQDAIRLYYHLAEYFPTSPLAGEALWRAADDKWQIDKADIAGRPSSHERAAYLRPQIDEDLVKEVEKKFPGTRWADMASYLKLDNEVCGEWQGDPKCPEKETEMYETYAQHHPQSPRLAEALYNAAFRQACLVDIYRTRNDAGRSDKAKEHALELAQRVASLSLDKPDYGTRAERLIYMLENNIAVYGSGTE